MKLEANSKPEYLKEQFGLKRKPSSALFRTDDGDGKIYPNYFAPVIVLENEQRSIKWMRYRVRPKNSTEEIPSKYNVFNARKDSLLERSSWKHIFGKNHCLFPFIKFYEWVEQNGKKKLINFHPDNYELMWAPGIFDTWISPDKKMGFNSFAIITDDPPPEINEAGHDRCPIFLKEDLIDEWLNPKKHSQSTFLELLEEKQPTYFEHED